MRRMTADELRRRTLQRQFPSIDGQQPEAVLELFNRLGPIQSQVPRARSSPCLAVAGSLVQDHQRLVRRAPVAQDQQPPRDGPHQHAGAVRLARRRSRRSRAAQLRNYLKLDRLAPEDVVSEVEAFAYAEWRPRADIVAHLREWLVERESPASAAAVRTPCRRACCGVIAACCAARATTAGRNEPTSTTGGPAACCPRSRPTSFRRR